MVEFMLERDRVIKREGEIERVIIWQSTKSPTKAGKNAYCRSDGDKLLTYNLSDIGGYTRDTSSDG